MSFEIKPATRQGIRPLIGVYGESGTGKSYSSLLLARGFVGKTGKIAMIDSESGRGSLYADVLPGGYDVLDLTAPFSPARCIEAIQSVEQGGYQIGIIDSGSHEWEGIGGVLDMASDNEQKSGKTGLHNWKAPKMEHAKFVLKLLQSSLPWIICLRAKHKTRQGKNEQGKTVIIKDDFTTPLQADDFIFEMTVHGEVMQDHSFRLTKCSHPALGKCFPGSGPVTIQHGELLAQWCSAPSGVVNETPRPQSKTKDPRTALMIKLWDLTKEQHLGKKGDDDAAKTLARNRLTQWLIDEALISDTQTFETLALQELEKLVPVVERKLNDFNP